MIQHDHSSHNHHKRLYVAVEAAAAGLTAIALAKGTQAVLFSALAAGLIVIAGAPTWRLWYVRKLSAD